MKKNKGFTIIELSITITLSIIMLVATIFYKKATVENQLMGAQLALMKLYETQQLYFRENNEYTDNLDVLWEYHKRIPEYPVTIVDERKRSLKRDKIPIKYLRIGDYDIDIKVGKDKKSFKIKATPIHDSESKITTIFFIDQNKKRKHPKKWTLEIK